MWMNVEKAETSGFAVVSASSVPGTIRVQRWGQVHPESMSNIIFDRLSPVYPGSQFLDSAGQRRVGNPETFNLGNRVHHGRMVFAIEAEPDLLQGHIQCFA